MSRHVTTRLAGRLLAAGALASALAACADRAVVTNSPIPATTGSGIPS
jgi:hypothetical protein